MKDRNSTNLTIFDVCCRAKSQWSSALNASHGERGKMQEEPDVLVARAPTCHCCPKVRPLGGIINVIDQ